MNPARVAMPPMTDQPQALSSRPAQRLAHEQGRALARERRVLHAAGDPFGADLGVGLAARNLGQVDADLVLGVELCLLAGEHLLAGVGREGRVCRGLREEDLLRGELVVNDLLVIVTADDGECADDDHACRGDGGDRGQAGQFREQRAARRVIGLRVLVASVGDGIGDSGGCYAVAGGRGGGGGMTELGMVFLVSLDVRMSASDLRSTADLNNIA